VVYLREVSADGNEDVCIHASTNGHLHVLKWAITNVFHWDESTCNFAAGNGHVEVLKWARSDGCP